MEKGAHVTSAYVFIYKQKQFSDNFKFEANLSQTLQPPWGNRVDISGYAQHLHLICVFHIGLQQAQLLYRMNIDSIIGLDLHSPY